MCSYYICRRLNLTQWMRIHALKLCHTPRYMVEFYTKPCERCLTRRDEEFLPVLENDELSKFAVS